MRGLFIIGSSTDVGKTYVATQIVRDLVARGKKVGVYKPAASGCRVVAEQLVSDDAVALWEAAGRLGRLEDVCPQRFSAPLAPHLAAERDGCEIDEDLLFDGLEAWQESEIVIVEGAGGWFSPLSESLLNADLAIELQLPVVIVVRNTIGAINQALLTLSAALDSRPSVTVAAIVLNQTDSTLDASVQDNATALAAQLKRQQIDVPLLTMNYGEATFHPKLDWWQLSKNI